MSETRRRIDIVLVEKGLASSRERAQALIIAGKILVNDVPVTKPGTTVTEEADIRVRGAGHEYVSRGALKLKGAIESFGVSCQGRVGLDIGSSTGGFTEVLLKAGAVKVHSIDVGHNQLDWKLRSDPRVVLKEGVNARHLRFEDIGEKVGVIVVDVSFISLDKILPALIPMADRSTDWVTLIKPQFEVGREKVGKGGIVRSEDDRQEVVTRITQFARSIGLERQGLIESPITGTDGNQEFLAHWKLGD